MRKDKIIHVKKLENLDFSNQNFVGKKLLTYILASWHEYPGRIYIGEIKNGEDKALYLKGFGLINADGQSSELKKQRIFGRDYFGREPFYSMPLTLIDKEDYFYEFVEEVNIDKLRDIANGNKQRIVIKNTN